MSDEPRPDHDGNHQRIDQGAAVQGNVHGGINLMFGNSEFAAAEKVVKPRFREGPYPAEDVAERLRTFVEPPSIGRCRDTIDRRRVLLLAGSHGSGVSTAAFALLRERIGGDSEGDSGGQIIGLDPSSSLTDLKPSKACGYLVRGLSAESAKALTDVALAALQNRLRAANAHLVIIVDPALRLPGSTARWRADHEPPLASDVARVHLAAAELTEEQLSIAMADLGHPLVKGHLEGQPPGVGVEVAEELRHVALGDRQLPEAMTNLTRNAAGEATDTLLEVRTDADGLALATSIALLERQDRTLITRCAAELRPLLDPPPDDPPRDDADRNRGRKHDRDRHRDRDRDRDDVLGDDLTTRLHKINAQALPRVVESGSRYWYRYWVEPVAFRRKHLAETILARLWLDHDGIGDAVLTWLLAESTRYSPGMDYVAGLAIGRVLRRATGPDVLRQLAPLAASSDRWRRRLVAYALNEAAEDGLLAGAVRDQLWDWSYSKDDHLRATVADTCAGGFGLVRPERTLRMLDHVLDGPDRYTVRTAVSQALAVLLTEAANTELVLATYAEWIARPEDGGQRAYALGAIPQLITEFLQLDVDDPGPLLPLVIRSLDDDQARQAVVDVLLRAERSLIPGTRARATALITALATAAGDRRGVRALLVARLRQSAHSTKSAEGTAA
ncbi:hypothetical protein [Streptomyces mayteni]